MFLLKIREFFFFLFYVRLGFALQKLVYGPAGIEPPAGARKMKNTGLSPKVNGFK